jgi:hypothetical protein
MSESLPTGLEEKEEKKKTWTKKTDFEKKKTVYFSDFILRHKKAFYPHRYQGQLLRKKALEFDENGQEINIWRNVAEHCLIAGVMADILAERLGLSDTEREQVVHAAILHDWHKKYEAGAIDQARNNGTFDLTAMESFWKKDKDKLRAFTLWGETFFDERTIALSGANTPDTAEGPQTDQEKIIWYVDAMISNDKIEKIADRFFNDKRGFNGKIELEARKQRAADYSNMFIERFGFPLSDVQLDIAVRLNDEFANRLGYTGDSADVPVYLEQLLTERISSTILHTR